MKKKPRPHKGHAWCSCDGICVPQQLHESFEAQLGPRVHEFSLFTWYEKRNRERKAEMLVVFDVWTQWREEFQAELRARGWVQPKKFTPKTEAPVQTERLTRLNATFGRTKEETQRQLQEMIEYRRRQSIAASGGQIADFKMKQGGDS